MSQRNKLSLWQKIKRLLTASAPRSVVDATNKSPASTLKASSLDSNKSNDDNPNDHTEAGAKSDTSVDSEHAQTVATRPNTEQSEHNATPIVDFLKKYFDDRQWHYTHYQPKIRDEQQSHHLSLRMRHKQLNCGYLFRVQENNRMLAVYGILPFLIPESHQSAAMLLITQLNYDMLIGSLEMDNNDGEIRYKNAIDVEAVGINDKIIDHLLQSVIAMTTVANELFSDLVDNQDPAEDLPTLLTELRQQADSRTFFLPTQFVQ